MGNIVKIMDKDKNEIAEASHGLLCYSYFTKIAGKYNPVFIDTPFMVKNINEEMKKVYSQATPEDEVVCLVFMNDSTHFTQEHVPAFEKAIADYPDDYHEGPKRVLTKMLELLKKYGELYTEYSHTTTAFSVRQG